MWDLTLFSPPFLPENFVKSGGRCLVFFFVGKKKKEAQEKREREAGRRSRKRNAGERGFLIGSI